MRSIKANKIKSSIISNPSFRLIRAFFYNKILPYLRYSFYFFAIILSISWIYLAIFQESKLETIKNYLIKYSYKIVNFSKSNIRTRINIQGNKYTDYDKIVNFARQYLIKDQDSSNHKSLESLKNDIKTLPWVKELVIGLSLRDSLNIKIIEYQPFAIWKDGNKKYIISKNSKIIAVADIEKFNNLVILTGRDAPNNAKSLFNVLSIDPEISKNVYSATWIGGRRWDIRFENGLLAKLPNSSNKMQDAWNSLIRIYNLQGSLNGLKSIDLRIADKIFLEYDKDSTQEIKDL